MKTGPDENKAMTGPKTGRPMIAHLDHGKSRTVRMLALIHTIQPSEIQAACDREIERRRANSIEHK